MRYYYIALLVATVLPAACVSPPSRVDEAAENRAAQDPEALGPIASAAEQSGDLQAAQAFYARAAELAPMSQLRGLQMDQSFAWRKVTLHLD